MPINRVHGSMTKNQFKKKKKKWIFSFSYPCGLLASKTQVGSKATPFAHFSVPKAFICARGPLNCGRIAPNSGRPVREIHALLMPSWSCLRGCSSHSFRIWVDDREQALEEENEGAKLRETYAAIGLSNHVTKKATFVLADGVDHLRTSMILLCPRCYPIRAISGLSRTMKASKVWRFEACQVCCTVTSWYLQ